jgi:hypothetical protein
MIFSSKEWYFPILLCLSMLCVNPLFRSVGLTPPLQTSANDIPAIFLYVVCAWGITVFLMICLKFFLFLKQLCFSNFTDAL